MGTFQCSPQHLQNAATNATAISGALAAHQTHALPGGDLGHAAVASALDAFARAWSAEFRARATAADLAAGLLAGAARDTARVEQLLARAASRLGGPQ